MLFRRSPPRLQAPRPRSGDVVQVEGHSVRLAVNARARRVSLRLDAQRREVVATAPSLHQLADALAFAEARASWIAQRMAGLAAPVRFVPGVLIEVGGRPVRLERAAMRTRPTLKPFTELEPARLIASGEGEAFARAVQRALRTEALVRLQARTAYHCGVLGQPVPPVALQDARSRWGSCRKAQPGVPAAIVDTVGAGGWFSPRPRCWTMSPPTNAPIWWKLTTGWSFGPWFAGCIATRLRRALGSRPMGRGCTRSDDSG